jgi:hypothetical protein
MIFAWRILAVFGVRSNMYLHKFFLCKFQENLMFSSLVICLVEMFNYKPWGSEKCRHNRPSLLWYSLVNEVVRVDGVFYFTLTGYCQCCICNTVIVSVEFIKLASAFKAHLCIDGRCTLFAHQLTWLVTIQWYTLNVHSAFRTMGSWVKLSFTCLHLDIRNFILLYRLEYVNSAS